MKKTGKGILVLAVFILLCSNSYDTRADDETTTQLRDTLKRKATSYALICYRPDASLTAGSTHADWRQYVAELTREIDAAASLRRAREGLKKLSEKLDNKVILECAKRNFSYLSEDDLRWFQIFDEYGQEIDNFTEGFIPYKETILNSHLIMVGNHHGFSTQGDILFGLTDFIEQQKKNQAGLLVEMREESLKELKNIILRTLSFPIKDTEAASQEVGKILLDDIRKKNQSAARLFEMMHLPRIKTWTKYYLQFPNIPMQAVDQRPDVDSTAPALTAPSLQEFLQSSGQKKRWVAHYGNRHVLRLLTSEIYQIEKELKVDGEPVRIFVISQGFGLMNQHLRHISELGSKTQFIQALSNKFAFPDPPIALDPAHKRVYKNWDQRIQKYNSFRKQGHTKPIFVNLLQALVDHKKDGRLKFAGGAAIADLLVIPPSDEPDNAPFDFEKDAGYQYLTEFIESIN